MPSTCMLITSLLGITSPLPFQPLPLGVSFLVFLFITITILPVNWNFFLQCNTNSRMQSGKTKL